MSPDNVSEQVRSPPRSKSQPEDEDMVRHVSKSVSTIILIVKYEQVT